MPRFIFTALLVTGLLLAGYVASGILVAMNRAAVAWFKHQIEARRHRKKQILIRALRHERRKREP